MNKNSVLVYDSGIGGINVLITLKKRFSNFEYYYLSDSLNSPYGTKGEDELYKIAKSNLERVEVRNFSAVVLACNTLSTNCINRLRSTFPEVEFFGVFPKVEVAEKLRTLLLCTEQTANSQFILKAKNLYPLLVVEPCQKLVCEVEKNVFSIENVEVKNFVKSANENFDCVLLGCTHFCFLRNSLSKLFPESQFFDGTVGTGDHFKQFATTFDILNQKVKEITFKNFILNDKMRNYSVYNYLMEKREFYLSGLKT